MNTTFRRSLAAGGSGRRNRPLRAVGATLLSLGATTLAVVGITTNATAADPVPGVIGSSGPLTSISTSTDLNCDVRYAGDTDAEFFGGTACGTLVALGGTLYGPANIPAGGAAAPRTGYTPVSQVGPTGQGTVADPYRVVTKVDLGASGVSLTQTDTYVTGKQSYQTSVQLTNGSGGALDAIVYRAGDCYLANSDNGLGNLGESTVACVANGDGNRVEQWIPITAGSKRYEAGYAQVWGWIGSQQMFPDTCRCAENIDNGAGLSWPVHLAASGQATVSHLTAFSPNETLVDRDGDGLLDDWETNGYDADGNGVVDVDLPAMGASPDHKDLFVEADWMVQSPSCVLFFCWGGRSFAPDLSAMRDVATAFAGAPLTNPDGQNGITLHVDAGPGSLMNPKNGATWGARSRATSVPWVRDLGSFDSSGNYNWSAFNALQSSNFAAARRDVFHYTIFADRYAGSGSSGIARVSDASFQGDSFLVTDGASGWGSGFTRRQESGTFMHEFGHTLGLRHGGSDNTNYKPNYQSIMNYFWQLGDRPLDYSRRQLGSLDESALTESAGLANASGAYSWFCGTARRTSSDAGQTDWNCSGGITSGTVASNLNKDGSLGTLTGFDDWAHLIFDGGAVGAFGSADPNDEDPAPEITTHDEPTAQSLREDGTFGAPGDGSVSAVGPSVLLPGASDQKLRFHVSNVGSTEATYRLHLSGLAGVPATVDVTVPALGDKDVDVPVTGTSLVLGDHTVTVSLTPVGDATELSSTTLAVKVPDPNDPAVAAQLAQIAQQLGTQQSGLPDAIRTQVVGAISQTAPTTAAVAPKLVSAPTFGAAKVGTTVTATGGSWTPAPSATAYQWLLGGQPLAGANSASLVVPASAAGKQLSVRVTVSGTGGATATATSSAATVALGDLTLTKKPKVKGVPEVGSVLKVSPGKVSRLGKGSKPKIQWLVGGKKVSGATSRSYKVRAGDVGKKLSVKITFTVPGYAPKTVTLKVGTARR